ncbi:6-bladed beta-propeller [candidate division KSB1 bacterium]
MNNNGEDKMKPVLFMLVIVVSGTLIFSCGEEKVSDNSYPSLEYSYRKLIEFDRELNNEALNTPLAARIHDEHLYVLDLSNTCVYKFDIKGNYISKFGREGHGPGELNTPTYMQIDKNENIYIYDVSNTNISIFDSNGEFLSSFQVNGYLNSPFHISEKNEILINQPASRSFISVFSKDGTYIKDIGDIIDNSDYQENNYNTLGQGWPFYSDGKYIFFSNIVPMIFVFDEDGSIIEKKILDYPEIASFWDTVEKPDDSGNKKALELHHFRYLDIVKRGDFIYSLIYNDSGTDGKDGLTIDVIVFDKKLNIVKKIYLPINEEIRYDGHFRFKFDVAEDGEKIILPMYLNAEVWEYFYK